MDSLGRRTLLLGLIAGAGAATAGCSNGSSSGSGGARPAVALGASPSGDPSSATASPAWPLTGRPLRDPAEAAHAAVAVKVPDNRNEHPQTGLDKADIVFVELDGYRDASGYGGTRLVPVFHSQMPKDVAPVRSIRPVDVPLLSPTRAIIGNTGATGWVLHYVKHYDQFVDGQLSYMATKGSGSYTINPDRVRTYQGVTYYDRAVVCHPRVLAKQTRAFRKGPPQAYFPFAADDTQISTTSAKSASRIDVPWKQGHSYDMSYHFDQESGRYLRSMPWGKHVLADGTRVAPGNVLVIRAKQHYGKIYPGHGGVEPLHDILNAAGTFYYFHGGRYVKGSWTKGAVDQTFQFTLADGQPLRMAPGQTYVELARSDAQVRITA